MEYKDAIKLVKDRVIQLNRNMQENSGKHYKGLKGKLKEATRIYNMLKRRLKNGQT